MYRRNHHGSLIPRARGAASERATLEDIAVRWDVISLCVDHASERNVEQRRHQAPVSGLAMLTMHEATPVGRQHIRRPCPREYCQHRYKAQLTRRALQGRDEGVACGVAFVVGLGDGDGDTITTGTGTIAGPPEANMSPAAMKKSTSAPIAR